MNNKNIKLAKQVKNDEFYTTKDTVEKLLRPFLGWLKDKTIICPCDNKTSEIYRLLKDNGFNVDQSISFENVDYSKYDVVVTNPPFSKMEKFMKAIEGKLYIVIGNGIWPTCMPGRKRLVYWSKGMTNKWKNSDKSVFIRFYSNIFNAWKKEKGETVVDRNYTQYRV